MKMLPRVLDGPTPQLDDYVPGTVRMAVRGTATVVALSGEHDLATLSAVERALREATGRGAQTIVDLTACTFIDCAVARAISRAENGNVAVVAPPATAGTVRRLLQLVAVPLTIAFATGVSSADEPDDEPKASAAGAYGSRLHEGGRPVSSRPTFS
jgi:anti-anti-sigma factor